MDIDRVVGVNCQFQDKFLSVVFNKDKEIEIKMGKKEAELLRLRCRLKARRVKHNAIISLMNHTLRRRDMTQFALCVQCLELGRGRKDWVLDP